MKIWTLVRIAHTSDETWGVLLTGRGIPFCVTLEDPWRFNELNRSCIPPGATYKVSPVVTPKYKETFAIEVPGRTAILIHSGNNEHHTEGCLLLGHQYPRGKRYALDVLDSADAVADFKAAQPREPFELKVFDRS